MIYLTDAHFYRKVLFLLFTFNLLCLGLFAQSPTEGSVANKIDSYNKTMPFEKLFLQTDKPYYSATDTLWFKAYLFNGLNNNYSPISGLIYVELVGPNSKVIQRVSFPVKVGLSWGQIALDEKTIEGGEYTLRAYTNWMQNFGEETFFSKRLYIANLKNQPWLIDQKQSITAANGKQTDNIDFHIKDLNNADFDSKNISWRIQDGDFVLAKGSTLTSAAGKFNANFNIPDKIEDGIKLYIEQKGGEQKTVIPLTFSRPENIDVQFMPEGGYLVAGVRTKVGFKAIAENGLGINVEGTIVDSKNNAVMPFKSTYKGMGALTFAPLQGEAYTAKVKLANGTEKSFKFPETKASGINLRVVNTNASDSVHVTVNISEDLAKGQAYQLVGLVNNVVYCQVNFQASRSRININVPKSTFPSGIVHFTVFNAESKPVSERATFVYNNDNLKIAVTSSKTTYKIRDSIGLHIDLKDKDGNPVPASSLSLSVTDNKQVKPDSLENNMVSDILLTSGLKGNIESPAYYFSKAADAADDLDLLLLTQGWTSYKWDDIFNPKPEPEYKPEPKFIVSGSVNSFNNKPVPGSKVLLMMGGKTKMITDTLTDQDGKFAFKDFPKFDTVSFFVQALNAKNKKANVALQLNEFTPATLKLRPRGSEKPWFINTDTASLQFIKNEYALEKQKFSISGNNMLSDVVISGNKTIKHSQNPNAQADQVIDEAQIAGAGPVPLLTFLMKNVKGLYLRTAKTDHYLFIESRKVNIVVDGLDIRSLFANTDSIVHYEDLVTELNNISIKDVIGVEVMSTDRNVDTYNSRLINDPENSYGRDAYIEITTRSGKGLIVKTKQNIASYKPVPVNWPREFYSPKYNATSARPKISDWRSTIFWQPHLAMSDKGDALTSFYAADKPGTYTVIVQGSNLKGLIGYKRLEIIVK